MIELFHVWKQYQKPHWALSDISLEIRTGEFCFITGPSGSGKTTLLKIIFRELIPTEGQILVDGVNILKIPDHKIYRLRRTMGIVFQDFRLLFHQSVFHNVAVPLQVAGLSSKEIRRRVFNALRQVNLHHKMWDFPQRLSYGEQQRVAIARAIVNNPSILLADEPTGNLDPELAFEIMSIFKEINQQGATVIIGSHDRELIRHFGDKIFFLQKGKIIGKEEKQ
ncbi:MAG: Cell division transporter, ATP-binding protein FtsE [Candidatus Saccharicenans subterraneus]|uniref:Cell division ATP-binding protein FtsE n=1 Tax=Candidatus Saccharicenans subterraneus TaxID=2508984 RepID=A0A3E2BPD3_9BACT|nr:MAG: Cell division transporter, ATP-binding protein FtsE [Candidatus Saccharicenans subterraneum]